MKSPVYERKLQMAAQLTSCIFIIKWLKASNGLLNHTIVIQQLLLTERSDAAAQIRNDIILCRATSFLLKRVKTYLSKDDGHFQTIQHSSLSSISKERLTGPSMAVCCIFCNNRTGNPTAGTHYCTVGHKGSSCCTTITWDHITERVTYVMRCDVMWRTLLECQYTPKSTYFQPCF